MKLFSNSENTCSGARGITLAEILMTIALTGLAFFLIHNSFFSGVQFFDKSGKQVESADELARVVKGIKSIFLMASQAPLERWRIVDPAWPPMSGTSEEAADSKKLFSFIDDPPTMVFFIKKAGNLVRVSISFSYQKKSFEIETSADFKKSYSVKHIKFFRVLPVKIKTGLKTVFGADFYFYDETKNITPLRIFPIQFNNHSADKP